VKDFRKIAALRDKSSQVARNKGSQLLVLLSKTLRSWS